MAPYRNMEIKIDVNHGFGVIKPKKATDQTLIFAKETFVQILIQKANK